MKKLRIYNENEKVEKKTVFLKLIENSEGVKLTACDEYGAHVADLLYFSEGRPVRSCSSALNCLEENGYDTDFAAWSGDGRMLV